MSPIAIIFWSLHIILIASGICAVIAERREAPTSLAWMSVIILVPIFGICLYMLLGRNHRKNRLFVDKEILNERVVKRMTASQIESLASEMHPEILNNKDIITLLLNNSSALLTTKNRIDILNNGTETFPAIIDAIKKAEQFIHLEYYIFEDDQLGRKIAKVLQEKATKGVEVRLIFDGVGSSRLSFRLIRQMVQAGVQVKAFRPVVFPFFTSKVNYRNHRKIVVIDGKIAFTGGLNVAERYTKATKKGIWRDTHLKIEGEAVKFLNMIFASDWHFVTKSKDLTDPKYYPECIANSFSPLQIASCGPDSAWASIMQAYFAAISRAKKHIYISSPYFLPNSAILTALKVASLSGIDVRVMIPNRSDSKVVYWASRSYIEEMLSAGIKVYLFRKGFNHSKTLTIDGEFCSIGTANMDNRSFEYNFEVSAIIYNKALSQELEKSFFQDIESCQEIKLKSWKKRAKSQIIYENINRLATPLL